MTVRRRLERLETRNATSRVDEEDRVIRGALRRLSTPDLRLVRDYFKRKTEGDAEPTEEEEAALGRYETLREEARSES